MTNNPPPPALQAAVDALAQRLGRRLALLAGARWGHWSLIQYTPNGQAALLVPAMEDSALLTLLPTLPRAMPGAPHEGPRAPRRR